MSYTNRFEKWSISDKITNLFKIIISYGIVLAVWQFLTLVTGELAFPSPVTTFSTIGIILGDWSLAQHIFITLYRTVLGVTFTAMFSLLLVIAATYIEPVRYFFKKTIYPASRALPAVSFALIAIIWFGLGTVSVVFVVFITILPIYLIDLWEELKVTDQPLIEMANSLTSSDYRVFRKVIAPMLVPKLFASTKLNFSVALKLALVGEVLAAQSGMGYKLYLALTEFRTDFLFAWTVLAILLIVLLEFYLFDPFEDRFLGRWMNDQ